MICYPPKPVWLLKIPSFGAGVAVPYYDDVPWIKRKVISWLFGWSWVKQ